MRNAGLEETQAGIKIGGRNINNLRYAKGLHLRLYRKSPGGLETASVLTTDDIMTLSSCQISLSGQFCY